jgi:hypothetical protein
LGLFGKQVLEFAGAIAGFFFSQFIPVNILADQIFDRSSGALNFPQRRYGQIGSIRICVNKVALPEKKHFESWICRGLRR